MRQRTDFIVATKRLKIEFWPQTVIHELKTWEDSKNDVFLTLYFFANVAFCIFVGMYETKIT